jgi:hypothetical protein
MTSVGGENRSVKKIRRFVNNGRTGSIPVSGTIIFEREAAPATSAWSSVLECAMHLVPDASEWCKSRPFHLIL